MSAQKEKIVRPDSKGRVTLGSLAKGISGFRITVSGDHIIHLEPYSEIPSRELWLFNNKPALNSVKKGLDDAKAGRIKKRGDFSKYVDDEIE